MGKRTMSLEDAKEFVDDNLPDGAYWAMVHEIAGADYGSAWHELKSHPNHVPFREKLPKTIICPQCNKKFGHLVHLNVHIAAKRRNGTHQ